MTDKPTNERWFLRPSEQRLVLIIGDIFATVLALFLSLALWAAGDDWLSFNTDFLLNRPPFWFYLLPLIWIILLVEIYELKRANKFIDTLKGIGLAVIVSGILYLVVYFSSEPNSLPRLGVALFIGLAALLTLLWRIIYIQLFKGIRSSRRVLIIGAGKAGQVLVNMIEAQKPTPFIVVGLIDDDPGKIGTKIGSYEILAGSESLPQIIKEHKISDLILAISGELKQNLFQTILNAQEAGLKLSTMVETYEEILGRVPIFLLEADWIIRSFVEKVPASNVYRLLKRGMDLLGGIVGILMMGVLLPFVSLAILINSGCPIFYSQQRLGRGGNSYKIIKFRTMRKDAEKDGEVQVTAKHDPRVTLVGRLLRKTHIDEMPQFFNVIRGEMSLVGPRSERPELVRQFQQEIPFYRARLLVKPGITGWAQINQNYAENTEETAIKLEYDLYYIQHRTIFMDIIILLRTFGSALGFKGR